MIVSFSKQELDEESRQKTGTLKKTQIYLVSGCHIDSAFDVYATPSQQCASIPRRHGQSAGEVRRSRTVLNSLPVPAKFRIPKAVIASSAALQRPFLE